MPIVTNADFSKVVALRARLSGEPVDVTGFEMEMTIKARRSDPSPVLVFSPTILEAEAGRIAINLTADQTRDLPIGDFAFDIVRVDGGRRAPIADGRVRIVEGVS